ncbi:uncharacterized protein IL334_003439 [Kwoniella shivajii]|uniref:Long chronological lifespan protein 2 n=1 Tax=Kwoniella shivajii TaxID=564305 RepID=A0ABZ1CXV7_9TREE|nr:hypothetical protein IL334_003439 [Kwoniella shivajii]
MKFSVLTTLSLLATISSVVALPADRGVSERQVCHCPIDEPDCVCACPDGSQPVCYYVLGERKCLPCPEDTDLDALPGDNKPPSTSTVA